MGFLKELLAKQRYPVILLVAGVFLILAGNYSMSGEVSKLQMVRQRPQVILNMLGVLCVLGSAVLFLVDEDFVAYRRGCKIRKTKDGFEARFRESKLCVDFGLLQELYSPLDQTSAVVLPANEFFDERCFSDERTAAGSFAGRYFSKQGIDDLKDLVHRELAGHPSEIVSTAQGQSRKSYGVGTCVYLGHPLTQSVRIIFAAIASDRAPHGLRVDLSTVFRTVEDVKCKLASERLSTVYIPLLGAGKGGVPAEIAFLTLISALLEARCRDGGHNLKEMHVVIFENEHREPDVSPRQARRALRQLVSLYQEMWR